MAKIIKEKKVDKEKFDAILEEAMEENKPLTSASYFIKIAAVVAIVLALFQLYTAGFGAFGAMRQRTIHLVLVCIMVFLLYPTGKKQISLWRLIDLALIGISAFVGVYLYIFADQFATKALNLQPLDVAVGLLGLVIVFTATIKVMGWIMPAIAGIFMIYALFGQYMPGAIAHRGFGLERISYQMFFTMEGVLGSPLGISATFVAVFVIFAAFLRKSGVGDFFMNIAFGAFGRFRGGPAKASVIASSLFGTFSGSSIANVVGTGTFTIPLMKKTGYKGYYAGAVEAVSSSGGQIMPPVMGAAAFLMTEFIDMTYPQIMFAAILPAVMYYIALFFMVDLEAGKEGILGLPASQLPSPLKEIRMNWILLSPIVVLLYLLITSGSSPSKAGFWATITVIVLAALKRNIKFGLKELLDCLAEGGKSCIEVATACATAGIIVGVITLTGLGMKLSNVLISLAGGSTLLLLILTALVCIVLGMGVPTTACYLLVATLVAPALIKIGILPIAAHLFVFYFGVMAMITPPVALASYAAAGIADADPMKTGFQAMRLGIVAFIVPFMFVYDPTLLMQNTTVVLAIKSIITALIGTYILSVALEGWFRNTFLPFIARLTLFAAGLCLIDPDLVTDMISIALIVISIALTKFMNKRKEKLSEA